MSLTSGQARFYTHQFRSFRPVENNAATGKVGARTGELVLVDIPSLFQPGQSYQGETAAILVEGDNSQTLDPVYMEVSLDVRVGDALQQTTGPDVGDWWIVRGNPQTRQRTNHQKVLCSREPVPPGWVPEDD